MLKKRRSDRSKARSALRLMWLRSTSRSTALKITKYCCSRCGVKQSKAKGKEQKIEVHHKKGSINWDKILDMLDQELLVKPDQLEPLCPNCHKAETYKTTIMYNPYGN